MIRKQSNSLLFLFGVVLLSVASCKPENKAEQIEEDSILAYISENPALAFEKKASGLYYFEVLAGQGELAQTGDTVSIRYTGRFLDETVFDSNIENTEPYRTLVNVGALIPGFDEGLTYMRNGGKAIFLIPSNLGYGSSGYYFPGYTPILFEVEIVELTPGPLK
jgi:FKBP-type peptidyl-prolyl cis-trans isomerase